ncbi:hypothetical protein [Paenibacillus aestuarii]|uniref:Uncharacterized protein n=1 Tax=Paenibacillus aestuarii TaxID=516965 RepID=A0ABW0K5D5_9BACL|nr:hypothetical protein [Paenibacillus aestuarii]
MSQWDRLLRTAVHESLDGSTCCQRLWPVKKRVFLSQYFGLWDTLLFRILQNWQDIAPQRRFRVIILQKQQDNHTTFTNSLNRRENHTEIAG